MTDFKKAFGQRLKAIRQARGISQARLADMVACETNTISNLETGTHGPRFALLEAIADALGAHPRDFFDFAWPPREKRK